MSAPPAGSPEPSTGTDPRDAYLDTSGSREGMGRQLGKASVAVLIISTLKAALLFGGIAITARLIPPEEYAVFAITLPVVMLAIPLAALGMPEAIIQHPRLTHALASMLFWVNLAGAVAAILVIALLSEPLSRVFGEPRATAVYLVSAFGLIPAAMAGLYSAILRRRLEVRRYEWVSLGGGVVGIIVAVVAALGGASYWALVAQQLAGQVVTVLLAVIVTGWLPTPPNVARLSEVRSSLRFGGYVAGFGALHQLTRFAGTAIVSASLTPVATSLFHRATNLVQIPITLIMHPMAGVVTPSLSRLQEEGDAFRATYARLTSRANLILMPGAVVLATGAEPIVRILLGPTWAEVAPILAWMSVLCLRSGVETTLNNALTASGRSGVVFAVALIRFLCAVAALLLAVPYGLHAMVMAFALTELLISLPIHVVLAVRNTPLTYGCVLRASLFHGLFAIGVSVSIIAFVDPVLSPLPAILHLIALGLLVGAIYAVRVAVDPSLRHDVLRSLEQVFAKVLPQRVTRQ